jgi:dynein heavy chain
MKTLDEITSSPSVMGFSMVHLDCDTLKQDLASKSNQLIQKLVEQVLEINRKANLA